MTNEFVFMMCQLGAERALKNEVAQVYPDLKFAFSRPGFLTFKVTVENSISDKKLIFARHSGRVIDQAKGSEKLPGLAQKLSELSLAQKLKVHAFCRDAFVPGDEPDGFDPDGDWKKFLLASGLKFESLNKKSQTGDRVLNWIQVDPDHAFIAEHIEPERPLIRRPGRVYPASLIEKGAPSRAQLKIKETLERYGLSLKPEMRVIEIGCSPGGATQLMLDAGCYVMGIDPKRMAFGIEKNPRFKWIGKEAALVERTDFEGYQPDLLVMDINLAPLEAIDQWGSVLNQLKREDGDQFLKHAFLTIKLNDWAFADQISLYFKRIQALGFEIVDATQLSTNRQEFFVLALYHGKPKGSSLQKPRERQERASRPGETPSFSPDRQRDRRGYRARDQDGARGSDAVRTDRKTIRPKAR